MILKEDKEVISICKQWKKLMPYDGSLEDMIDSIYWACINSIKVLAQLREKN